MTTLPKREIVLFCIILLALTSCKVDNKKNEPVWSDLPEVTNLKTLRQTDFVITLENPISKDKNIIYAPAFLYAWDKIKEKLAFPILADNTNSTDFNLLNKSILHQGSLSDSEYSATVEIIDGAIVAKAFFNKTLPFETKLEVLNEPIIFDTTKVSAFGMYGLNDQAVAFTHILYYKDDSNFILKLVPKDKQQEILLIKGLGEYQTLKEAIDLTGGLLEQGKKEQTNSKLLWKYKITDADEFAIPAIQFNIETNYKNIEGQDFSTGDHKMHSVDIAYQRTGFILNENGAVVESEALAVADSAMAEPIMVHPKKMIFDRPFLIIIKSVNKSNPYFVMKVANAELLIKK